MTLDQIKELIGRIRYKPNWTITVKDGRGLQFGVDSISIAFKFTALDATNPKQEISIQLAPILTAMEAETFDDKSDFLRWLRWKILQFEEHELDEWLTLDGNQITNPHPEERAA